MPRKPLIVGFVAIGVLVAAVAMQGAYAPVCAAQKQDASILDVKSISGSFPDMEMVVSVKSKAGAQCVLSEPDFEVVSTGTEI